MASLSNITTGAKSAGKFVKGISDVLEELTSKSTSYAGINSTPEVRQAALDTLISNPADMSKFPSIEDIATNLKGVRDVIVNRSPNYELFGDVGTGSYKALKGISSARLANKELPALTNPYALELGMQPVLDEKAIMHLLSSGSDEDLLMAAENIRKGITNRGLMHSPANLENGIQFYGDKATLNNAIAEGLDINPDLITLSSGFTSNNAGPMIDTERTIHNAANMIMGDNGLYIPGSSKVKYGQFSTNATKGLDSIIKNGSYDASIPGMQNKIYNYTGSIMEANALNKIKNAPNEKALQVALKEYEDMLKNYYTVDTMDLRAASGLQPRNVASISGNPLAEVLQSGIGKGFSKLVDTNPATAQANIWFPSRLLTSQEGARIPDSFSKLSDDALLDLLKMFSNKGNLQKASDALSNVKRTNSFMGQDNYGAAQYLSNLESMIMNAIAGGKA